MGVEMEKTLERVERWFVVALTVWGACAFVAAASGANFQSAASSAGSLALD
jgi:hypothetical protein